MSAITVLADRCSCAVKRYVGNPSIANIVGSNPKKDMEDRLLCLLCMVLVAASARG